MENTQKLTKKEKKELRKLEWQEKEKKAQKQEKIRKYSIWGGSAAVIILSVLGLMWLVSSSPNRESVTVNVAPVSETDITKGNKDAKVTLIEYADFQCPACAQYAPVVNAIMEDYQNEINFVFRMLPLSGIHKNARMAAQASYAAYKQDKFWEMHDLLYENQKEWATKPDPRPEFIKYAKEIDIDLEKFEEDMNSNETKKYIEEEERKSLSEGMNSTPSFVLNGVKIQNPRGYEEFKALIDAELSK